MGITYDPKAPKKATNLTVNTSLLARSRALKINLSATLEQALIQRIEQMEAEHWSQQNRKAIDNYNHFIEQHGCLSDELRDF